LPLLQQRNLSWIAAEDFGNEKPTAQRVIAAVMALRLIRQMSSLDASRTYIGGMSGGGRVASQVATRFPQMFAGALYVVGADFWLPKDARLRQRAAANRYVFVTGERDFNRSDMKRIFSRYQAHGLRTSLLMDLPDFAHEYPDATQLAQAVDFLDAR
jgi:poly(3-hydroxybutyrate) depolymerase